MEEDETIRIDDIREDGFQVLNDQEQLNIDDDDNNPEIAGEGEDDEEDDEEDEEDEDDEVELDE